MYSKVADIIHVDFFRKKRLTGPLILPSATSLVSLMGQLREGSPTYQRLLQVWRVVCVNTKLLPNASTPGSEGDTDPG